MLQGFVYLGLQAYLRYLLLNGWPECPAGEVSLLLPRPSVIVNHIASAIGLPANYGPVKNSLLYINEAGEMFHIHWDLTSEKAGLFPGNGLRINSSVFVLIHAEWLILVFSIECCFISGPKVVCILDS